MTRVKKEGRAQLTGNPALEWLTRTNPVIHVITYGGMTALFLSMNETGLTASLALFASGLFVWTLMEYVLHRYLFHIGYEKFQYFIHGVHHEFPRDKERLLMPPVPGLFILSVIFGICYLFLRDLAFVFVSGIVTGYMLYTFIHYVVHVYKPVKGFKFLWSHHHKHHNPALEHSAFGVSSPLWDYIFGTMPPKGKS